MLWLAGPPDDCENDPEPRSRNSESHQNLVQLYGQRRGGTGRKDKASRVEHGPQNNGPAIPQLLGESTEEGCPEAPCEVLNRNRQTEFRPWPAELLLDGYLEHTERCPNRESHEYDYASDDQDGREEGTTVSGGSCVQAPPLPRKASATTSTLA